MSWEARKKDSKSFFGEQEIEAISAIRNTVIHVAENFWLGPILELISDKESNLDQELANCKNLYDMAT